MSTDAVTLLAPYVAEQCRVVISAEPTLRSLAAEDLGEVADSAEGADLVEVVHDARVAVRRLRSTLRTFGDAFREADAQVMITEGAWYAGCLGRLRDLDVIGERVTASLAVLPAELIIGPVADQVRTDLDRLRAERRTEIAIVVASERYAALHDALSAWAEQPVWAAGAADVDLLHHEHKAKKRWKRRRATARDAVRDHRDDAGHLMHQARKAAKRHRYAVELTAPLIGAEAETIIARRKAQQDDLGGQQDSLVTVEYLLDLAVRTGRRSGRNAFTLGVLVAAERRTQAEAQRAFAG